MSFKMAGRMAMREALPGCQPVLLEPIYHTTIHAVGAYEQGQRRHFRPTRPDSRLRRARRLDGMGQRHGDDAGIGLQNLIIELRSITQGAATFEHRFDHYEELHGKDAEKVVAERKKELSGGAGT